jgi:hypothetical protein
MEEVLQNDIICYTSICRWFDTSDREAEKLWNFKWAKLQHGRNQLV